MAGWCAANGRGARRNRVVWRSVRKSGGTDDQSHFDSCYPRFGGRDADPRGDGASRLESVTEAWVFGTVLLQRVVDRLSRNRRSVCLADRRTIANLRL